MIVNANQLLFPKDDLKITERKYLFKVILLLKINKLANKKVKRIYCDLKNRIIDLNFKVLV